MKKRGCKNNFSFAILFTITSTFLLIPLVSSAIIIASPVDSGNYTGSLLFNVTYVNVTDIATPLNATFYYNLSGTWTRIENTSATGCALTGNNCNITLSISGLTDGFYSINATLDNGTDYAYVTVPGNLATEVLFDNTPPIVYPANISSPLTSSNYSSTLILNVSVVDALAGVNTVYFNITNSSGHSNATYTATNEASTSRYSVSINTINFPDGRFNVTVYANDSRVGNLNSSALSYSIIFDNAKPTGTLSCSPSSTYVGNSITCTCSNSDATSGVKTVVNTANPSTDNSGTYSTSCVITDYSSNTLTLTTSYTIEYFASTRGSSGVSLSPDSSVSNWRKTIPNSATELSEKGPITKILSEKNRVSIKVNSETHHVGVISVGTDSATLEIASTPVTAIFSIGETKRFNLDDDDTYDISVTLNSITGKTTDITITPISEEIPSSDKEQQATEETEESDKSFEKSESSISSKMGISIIIILLVIVILYYFLVLRKKR